MEIKTRDILDRLLDRETVGPKNWREFVLKSGLLQKNAATEIERVRAENERLRGFVRFVARWVHRGPPHGGPGNEDVIISAIKCHPAIIEFDK